MQQKQSAMRPVRCQHVDRTAKEGCTIEAADLLRRLQRKNTKALEQAVAQYDAYVMAIIRNRSRGVLTAEDQEEIASNVFLSLWRGAKGITRGQLRPWFGAAARNRTTDAMRRKQVFVPLEDDTPVLLGELWERVYEMQRCEAVQKALLALSDEDREIFYRFYDLAQTTAQIAEDLQLNASTVWSRLLRGRQTLRKQLCKGGMLCEDDLG